MPENLQFPLFVLAVLFFLGWFAVGIIWNVRKGDAVLKWLRQGLPLIGERTTMTWRGSSVVEMQIAKAKSPFRSAETLVVFEPRDVPFLWAFARLRGRRDLLIFRSQLRATPAFEVEIFDPHGWSTTNLQETVQRKNWTRLDSRETQSLVAYGVGKSAADSAKPLIDLAARAGGKVLRLAIHRDVPNLEIHWILPKTTAYPAQVLFSTIQKIGEDILSI
jgi:hypothetical protein